MSPAKVIQYLYKFLTTKVKSSIIKVRPEKFSIKAAVFHTVGNCLLHCVLKVRVYQAPRSSGKGQHFVAEFCRRQGDVVAFTHLFEVVSHHLKACDTLHAGTEVPEVEATISIDCILPMPRFNNAVPDLQPLIDMMIDDDCQTIQVEAITALLNVASANVVTMRVIGTALAKHQTVFQGFLASDHVEVSYPAKWFAIQLEELYSTPITV